MSRNVPVSQRHKVKQHLKTALAAIPDADRFLASIAAESGVTLAHLPPARGEYLSALLAEGRHCDALARCGMSEADFYHHWQDQRFRRVLRALQEVIEDIRRIKRHDHLDKRSYESDKVAMFVAERLDPRYAPPHIAARQGEGTKIQAVQINVLLPDGRPIGDHASITSENASKNDGFFERLLGYKPNNAPIEGEAREVGNE